MNNLNFPRINDRICGQASPGAVLFISPGFAIVPNNAQIQLSALTNDGSTDTAASTVTWESSDTSKATVDGTGLVTRVSDGDVVIAATADGQTAYAMIRMLNSSTACTSAIVGTVVVLDRSFSMASAFGTNYPSVLAAAKVIAAAVIAALATKDYMALEEFNGAPEMLVELTTDKTAITAALDDADFAERVLETTDIRAALKRAVDALKENTTITQRSIILISDGVIEPEPGSADLQDIMNLCAQFKEAGGVITTVGMNATNNAYLTLRDIATPGFFVNVDGSAGSVSTAVTTLLALKGRYCAG